eukprot:GSMAST32.ASY1.ANO1.1670.1 assembled CDS
MGFIGVNAAYRGYRKLAYPEPGFGRTSNPRVFLRLEAVHRTQFNVHTESLGTIVLELRSDIVPRTSENFRALCTHEHGYGYRRSKIHRVRKGLLQGGDIEYENGLGGKSIYGRTFADENFQLNHTAGTITMANHGKDSNNSQFVLLSKDAPWLDGIHVAFGRVIDGMDVIEYINEKYAKEESIVEASIDNSELDNDQLSVTPSKVAIRIVDCGELEPE